MLQRAGMTQGMNRAVNLQDNSFIKFCLGSMNLFAMRIVNGDRINEILIHKV